ncbi:hypothetical protein GJS41_02400 [Kangiella sp. HZ709]|nr:hypothetical protein [Kangiella sp. HZ709]
MPSFTKLTLATLISILTSSISYESSAGELSGQVQFETRVFTQEADFGQSDSNFSIAFEPEYYHQFDDSDWSFDFKPFYRWDSEDEERTHADIRELMFTYVGDVWEVKAGIGKVFWGVAESQHLVDVINQTDFVENIDGEDKLGQPMLRFSTEQEWGLFEFYLLPYFRERTFAGEDGRLRFPLAIDVDNPIYESDDEEHNLDAAIRWSRSIGDWEIGLAHFSGTSREPQFVLDTSNPLSPTLRPLYQTIDQTSLDVQATINAWLWKLEAISRSGFGNDRYWAAVGGLEYSFYDIKESGIDLGIILEYQTDSRELIAGGFQTQDSIVSGFRLALNDEQSTEALFGFSYSEEGQKFLNLEASRRIGNSWKIILEARYFTGFDDNNPTESIFYPFRNDDYIGISLEKYF